MKIGIVTLRSGKNVGGLLQAYAMQTILEQMGHKVEFIDYQLPIKNTVRSFISKSPLTTYYKCLDKFNAWRYRNFRNVKWLLNISPTHYKFYQELEINPPIYDYYIVGSDQVWNFSNLLVPFFLLKFVPQNRPKIAYAASMGQCRLNTNLYNDLKNELQTFKAISLREDKSLNFIKTLMGSQCNVQKTIDPTLLISKDYYTKISNKLTKMPSYYMVSYILSNLEKKQIKTIKEFSLYNNIELINLRNPDTCIRISNTKNKIVSVPEWLSYIQNATYVICSSFHATVFSIIFHKPFIVILPTSQKEQGGNERINSLLKPLNLLSHVVYTTNRQQIQSILDEKINWETIDNKILELRKQSIYFLKQNLE